MLLRETHCAIKKVSEFVQNRAGLENINPLLCVCRRADAIHAELAAEICKVLRADHERPAVFIESIKDRLWSSSRNAFTFHCIRFSTVTGVSGGVTVRFCVRTA